MENIRDLYRGINDFKKGYQPRTDTVKDGKGDLVADSHSVMAMWGNYFSQILNAPGVSDVRQAEIHTVEPLVPEPSALEVEYAIKRVQVNQDDLKLNGMHQPLAYADYVNILAGSVHTVKENAAAFSSCY
jgi:hypothetical protein